MNAQQKIARERPILFKGEMVRAILSGQKTQTRRIVKFAQPPYAEKVRIFYGDTWDWLRYDGMRLGSFKCPYGMKGDWLWVRETFAPCSDGAIHYAADGKLNILSYKPSIHMPRTACRLLLEVTDIRVERLNDISEEDAKAEGVDAVTLAEVPRQATMSRRADFKQLWESINGEESWNDNPWVWVVEFKRL